MFPGRIMLCGWLGTVAITVAGFAASAAADEKIDIPFTKYQLDNGLEVILHEDHSQPVVAVNIWYHVGAYHEPVGRSGFAHLFEHVMFQGSAHVGDDQHFKILEGLGVSEANGTTGFDRTNYFESVPANHLETALWLESDRMGFLVHTLTQDKLDKQRDVVKNERRQGTESQPYGLAQEKLTQTLFPKPHPYYGMIIGSMQDLDAASVQDVRDFFTKWYAPANATLVVAGDIEPEATKKLIEKYFSTLPTMPKPSAPSVAAVEIKQEQKILFDEPVANLTKVFVAWHTPAFYAPGDATADLLGVILSSGKASLLEKRLQRELELTQSIAAYQYSTGGQSMFSIEAVAREGVDPERVLAEIDKVLDEVRQGAINSEMLTRAINRTTTQFVTGLQRLNGFGGKADQLQRYNHFKGDPGWVAADLARYQVVTADEIKQFASTTLANQRRVVLIAVPTAKADSASPTQEVK